MRSPMCACKPCKSQINTNLRKRKKYVNANMQCVQIKEIHVRAHPTCSKDVVASDIHKLQCRALHNDEAAAAAHVVEAMHKLHVDESRARDESQY